MSPPYTFFAQSENLFHYSHHFTTLQGSIKGLLLDWESLKTLGIGYDMILNACIVLKPPKRLLTHIA